ncbi:hypothetical protein F5D26_22105 [Burkholderia pseudomallei]|nr:hypothetical protein EGY14_07755 [Burkholderia pseudomallei]KAA8765695.1 hypothetical protein F5D26_22105 [Burkholderia pseudomallei]MBM5646466.1 hypothetical protein [Burkholderia pseudomallei]
MRWASGARGAADRPAPPRSHRRCAGSWRSVTMCGGSSAITRAPLRFIGVSPYPLSSMSDERRS